MHAKLLTLHILILDNVTAFPVTDRLNEVLGNDPLVRDWEYENTTVNGVEPPTVSLPDDYKEGDFLSYFDQHGWHAG